MTGGIFGTNWDHYLKLGSIVTMSNLNVNYNFTGPYNE